MTKPTLSKFFLLLKRTKSHTDKINFLEKFSSFAGAINSNINLYFFGEIYGIKIYLGAEKEEIEETYGPDVNPQVAAYFEDLLEANPSVEKLREDILSQRTLIEAQRTYMRLKGLLSTGDYHYTERKVRRPKNTFVEADSGNLKIRKGWV